MGRPRIVLVASEPALSASIATTLEALDMNVVATPERGDVGLELTQRLRADATCVTVPLGGPLNAVETAIAIRDATRVPVVLCARPGEPALLDAARRAEAPAYVVHGSALDQYREAFRSVLARGTPPGEAWPGLPRADVDVGSRRHGRSGTYAMGLDAEARPAGLEPASVLSAREQEVFELLARGRRVAEVADVLFISAHTVRKHAKAIFRKLGVHSQVELMRRYGARTRTRTPGPR